MIQRAYDHSFIEADAGYDAWGAMAVGDFDCDGRPEFVTGGKGGGFFHLYDLNIQTSIWDRHVITGELSPNVGAAATDLDGDGRPEIICGEWGPRLLWFACPTGDPGRWDYRPVYEGLTDPHDLLAADFDSDGRDEIIVRNKDGALLLFRPPGDPAGPWPVQVIANRLEGDGTVAAPVVRPDVLDIITNVAWFENARGDGSVWVRHPFVPEKLDLHPESRVVVGDLDGNGTPVAVVTESEIPNARMVLLHYAGPGQAWEPRLLIDRSDRISGMHSLQLADLDNDGKLEIFTAEMENGRTDGVNTRPRWFCLSRSADGSWNRQVLLDANLGSHSARAADFDGDGNLEIVGKVWRANRVNGAGGKNHVDFLKQSNRSHSKRLLPSG